MIVAFFLFVLGLCVGSFINAVQYRQESGLSMKGRSFCPKCKHKLAWYDLIPLFSWLFLSGKCRYCSKHISVQYPFIELLTGILFVGAGIYLGLADEISRKLFAGNVENLLLITVALILLLVIFAIFVLIGLHDAKTGYVLSALTYVGLIIVFGYLVADYHIFYTDITLIQYLLPHILAGLFFAIPFFLISFLSKEKFMGAGDAEIALFIGFFLGWPESIIALFIAILAGSIFGLVLIAKKKAEMKSAIPFGPFLIAGTILAYFYGDKLILYYAKMLIG